MSAADTQPPYVVDPYPTLARMREASPVSTVQTPEGVPIWIVTRYHDVRAGLADPRLRQDVRRAQALASRRVQGLELGADVVHMLNSDPPDHTRLRQLIHSAFTPRQVTGMRPMIERIVGHLISALSKKDTADLVRDFAFPFPILIICELLGFPAEDRDSYRRWSTAILTDGGELGFEQAMTEMTEYLSALITRRRTDLGADMLSGLIRAGDEGRISEREIVATVFLLLIGGHETTVNLVGTSMLALLREPEQAAWLRTRPEAMPGAVEELLRFESPVRMATLRFTTEPVLVSGAEIPGDALVLLSLGAANRDPARFPEPDRLRLDRGDPGHLAFGHGIHRCLGAFLGKLEAELALSALLRNFPDMAITADVRDLPWRNTIMLRGLESLPVALHG